MNDSAMLGGWRFRSKHELAARVERYAASIGKPVDEVLLSLLFSALDDLNDISGEYNALKGALEDFPAWVSFMLSVRRMTQRELCERVGIALPTLSKILHHRASPKLSTAVKIIDALCELDGTR